MGNQWLTFRAHYEHADRTGDGLDEAELVQIGEQPKLRHFDVADRTRDKFTGQVDITPVELVTVSLSAGLGNDDYPDSYFGLQEASFRVFTAAVDCEPVAGLRASAAATATSSTTGLQTLADGAAGQTPDQVTDPRRDWTHGLDREVNYFSVYVTPPRFGNTEARLWYDYARSEGRFVYGLAPDTTLPTPVAVAGGVQQASAVPGRRAAPRVVALASDPVVPLRAFRRLRLRLRSHGDRQHHPAELDGAGLRLSSLYGPLGRRRPGLRVVGLPSERSLRLEDP